MARTRHLESRPHSARWIGLACGLAIATVSLAMGSSAHQDLDPAPGTDAERPIAPRRIGYGIELGYGAGIAPRDKQRGRDVSGVQTLSIQPRLRVLLADAGDGSAWYHGRLEGTLAGLLLMNFDPQFGAGGGALAGLRYALRPTARLQPYCDGAIGVGGLGFDLQSQANGLAFFIQAGFGARWRLDEKHSLTGALRWQHISNAQTKSPNAGIGTLGFQLGIDFW